MLQFQFLLKGIMLYEHNMKNKILKREHFEYLDKIVQILGFINLADYETYTTYDILKLSQNKICINVNATIDTFKQLFPLNEFDLRKIKYKFENIDQVIGFVKKLFFYLNVPIEYENKTLRLIPQNKLYNEYIKMIENRDIPQIKSNKLFEMDDTFMTKYLEDLHKPSKNIEEYTSYSEILKMINSDKIKESYLINNNIELHESELDFIEMIEVVIPEYNNKTYNATINFGGNVILSQEINKFNNKIYINLPNYKNIMSCGSTLQISKIEQDYCEYMTNSKNTLQINLHGIIFKNVVNEKYIKFDHDTNFYSFDLIYVLDNNKIAKYKFEHIDNTEPVYFSSILKYLKQPYTKQYIINDHIDLSTLEFKYFHTIRIALSANETKKRLKIGTTIKLKIGGIIEYEKIITKADVFDGNFYILNLNLPNYYFYQYHCCELSINSNKNNEHFLEILGSDLKMSFPVSKLSKKIILDHDEQWNQPGKYIFVMWQGMIGKKKLIDLPNDEIAIKLMIKQLYKNEKLYKNIFNFNGIEFNCLNVDNTSNDNIENMFGLTLLVHRHNNEHYKCYNSVAIKNWTILRPHLRKFVGDKVHFYYYLDRSTDFMLEMELSNLEGCEYNAYIMSKNIKYTNFNEPFNLIGNSQAKLIIEANICDIDEFEHVNVCIKGVYTNQDDRRTLAHM